jgi:hypothetical protein
MFGIQEQKQIIFVGIYLLGHNMKGTYLIKKYKDGKLIWQSEPMENLIMKSSGYGLNLVMRQLAGDTTYGIEITKAKIGDDDTAPTDNDTDLGNVLVDNIDIASQSVSNNILVLEIFISDDDLPDDDYKEFGLFIGNQLFARSVISPTYTKASGEDTTIEYTITSNNT